MDKPSLLLVNIKDIYGWVRQLNPDLTPKSSYTESLNHLNPYVHAPTPKSEDFVNNFSDGQNFHDLVALHGLDNHDTGLDYLLDAVFYSDRKLDLLPLLNYYHLDREFVDPVKHYLCSLSCMTEFSVSNLFISALYPPEYVKLALAVLFLEIPLDKLPAPLLSLSNACNADENVSGDEFSSLDTEPSDELLKDIFPQIPLEDALELWNSVRKTLQANVDAKFEQQLAEAEKQSSNITQIFDDCAQRMEDLTGKLVDYSIVQEKIFEEHKPIPERPDIDEKTPIDRIVVVPATLASDDKSQLTASCSDDGDDIQIISGESVDINRSTSGHQKESSASTCNSSHASEGQRTASGDGVIDLTESGGSDTGCLPSTSGQDVIPIEHKSNTLNPSFNFSRAPPEVIPVLKADEQCLVRRHISRYGLSHQWLTAFVHKVEDNLDPLTNAKKWYTVTYHGKTDTRKIDGKRVAFAQPSTWILPVGTRIAACYIPKTSGNSGRKDARPIFGGIVAEVPSTRTNWRYLIFFDDGDTQYCLYSHVFRVTEQSKEIWKDMDSDSATQNFIKEYLKLYPEKAMVRLHRNMTVKTERNEQWHAAVVLRVDASLAVLRYEDGQEETIYRGSERLWPLFEQKQQQIKAHQPAGKSTAARRNRTGYQLEFNQLTEVSNAVVVDANLPGTQQRRQTARKSTSGRTMPATNSAVSGNGTRQAPKSETSKEASGTEIEQSGGIHQDREYNKRSKDSVPVLYKPHDKCSTACRTKLETANMLNIFKAENPLFIPLECGWDRQIAKFRIKPKKFVYYKAPCGRRLRNIQEVLTQLDTTGSNLTIDMFSFHPNIEPRKEFFVPKVSPADKDTVIIKRQMVDIARGRESVHIPVVNTIDFSLPQVLDYSKERFADPKKIDLEKLKLATKGCDCEDDCRDAAKCSCHKRTMENSLLGTRSTANKKLPSVKVGYRYRRLMGLLTTGIFECNQNCKCSSKCLNRNIQNPLQRRLQVYKTSNKGWALRTLDDIPKGSFIATYSGQLLLDDDAECQGNSEGDEFFADLDFIEQLDGLNMAEINFSDEDSGSDDNDAADEEDNDDSQEACSSLAGDTNQSLDSDVVSPASVGESNRCSSEDSGLDLERKKGKDKSIVSKLPKTAAPDDGQEQKTLRERMFGNNLMVVIDAKTKGNVGRYLNHSCDPNVFVQNVLYDTHDYRFPTVAFFALRRIERGEELCWDYNYEIGSASGKRLDCRCGSENCRGRIL